MNDWLILKERRSLQKLPITVNFHTRKCHKEFSCLADDIKKNFSFLFCSSSQLFNQVLASLIYYAMQATCDTPSMNKNEKLFFLLFLSCAKYLHRKVMDVQKNTNILMTIIRIMKMDLDEKDNKLDFFSFFLVFLFSFVLR